MKQWTLYLGIGVLIVGGVVGTYWFLSKELASVSPEPSEETTAQGLPVKMRSNDHNITMNVQYRLPNHRHHPCPIPSPLPLNDCNPSACDLRRQAVVRLRERFEPWDGLKSTNAGWRG